MHFPYKSPLGWMSISSVMLAVSVPGAELMPRIVANPRITPRLLSPPKWKAPRSKLLFLGYALLKVVYQLAQLLWTLLVLVKRPDVILVQNPPAIPTLLVAKFVALVRGSKLVIDWHNLGFTILGLNLGKSSFWVKVAKLYERLVGRLGNAHFCVTKAMAAYLNTWSIKARVLYDRPPDIFRRLALQEQHEFFVRMHQQGFLKDVEPFSSVSSKPVSMDCSLFTIRDPKTRAIQYRPDRPALLVSSTSWTEDEDFSYLLDAVVEYDKQVEEKANSSLPPLLLVITGRGPQKEMYEAKIRQLQMKHVRIQTAWLAPDDYPRLLGSADLGVSLHTSSSNLDLPMKVVDMFGSNLPVCAINFECLHELVEDGKNGLIFSSSGELAQHLYHLFRNFPADQSLLNSFRAAITSFQKIRWKDSWEQQALPLLQTI